MKKSVGLMVMTKIPIDGNEVLVAVLQRRNYFGLERFAPRLYPGCYQVTAHGKLEPEDEGSFLQGISRECREELGELFTKTCEQKAVLERLTEVKTEEKEIITYGIIVPKDFLRMIRLDPDSGGLVYLEAQHVEDIVEISGETANVLKTSGPEYSHTIAMFPDELEAVRKAFEVFGKM